MAAEQVIKMLSAAQANPVSSGLLGGIGQQLSYGIGKLTGYNKAIEKDQLKQQDALNKQANAINRENMLMQYNLEKNMYDYTYDKQSASAQVERLKQAGLNPALMYSGGAANYSGGQTGNISGQSVSGGQSSKVNEIQAQNINSLALGLQMQKMQSEIKVNEAVANEKNAVAEKTAGVDTKVAESNIENIIANTDNVKLKSDFQRISNSINEIELSIKNATKDNIIEISDASVDKLDNEIESLYLSNKITSSSIDSLIKLNKLAVSKVTTEILNIYADTDLKKAHVIEISKEVEKMNSEILRLAFENKRDELNQKIEYDKMILQSKLKGLELNFEGQKSIFSLINSLATLGTGALLMKAK